PEWTCLLPVLLDEMVVEYGQTDLVGLHAGAAARYLSYELSRRDEDGLISSVLGDYLSPGSPGPAPEDRRLSGTLLVAHALRRLAHALERARDADEQLAPDLPAPDALRTDAVALERAVNAVFLDPGRG